MIQARVDLPDPLPPWISTPSPSLTVKLTSRSAVLAHGVPAPYSWLTPRSSSTGLPLRGAGAWSGTGAAALSTITMLSSDWLRLTVRSAISASLL